MFIFPALEQLSQLLSTIFREKKQEGQGRLAERVFVEIMAKKVLIIKLYNKKRVALVHLKC